MISNGRRVELGVGLLVLLGIGCLAWLSFRLGKVEVRPRGAIVRGEFSNAGGLAKGAAVEIAGVDVGHVERVELHGWHARVTLRVDPSLRLPDDTIMSVRTRGLIGDRFVSLQPGASARVLPSGGSLRDTEDAIDVEQLIAQFIHGKL